MFRHGIGFLRRNPASILLTNLRRFIHMQPGTVGPFHVLPAKEKPSQLGERRVAMLFGWTDGDLKHLAKYSSIYHDKGIDTLLMTAVSSDFFSNIRINTLLRKDNNELLKWLKEEGLLIRKPSRPLSDSVDSLGEETIQPHGKVIVQCFSNGGANSFNRFTEFLKENETCLPVSHIILDSCPGGNNKATAVVAMTMWIQNPFLKLIMKGFIWILLKLMYSYQFLIHLGSSDYKKTSPVFKASQKLLDKNLFPAPRLYLYSEADSIILSSEVEKHMQDAQRAGLSVTCKKWIDSLHVQHFRKHPNEYKKTIYSFIDQ